MTSLESIARERAEASGGQLLVLGIEDRQALVTLEQEIFPEARVAACISVSA